jgi:hypothetical protein
METLGSSSPSHLLPALAVGAVIGAVVVASLIGWAVYGTSILFTYAQQGLAWCL